MKPRRDKLNIKMGERSGWCAWSDKWRRDQITDKLQAEILRRRSAHVRMDKENPGETMANQYSGLLKHVLEKGRDNPYASWEGLAAWGHRTSERDMRTHIAKQFCWPDMNKPEVKRWIANAICGMRVLKLAFPRGTVGA